MSKLIKILTNILHKLRLCDECASGVREVAPDAVEAQTEPKRCVIEKEPLLALKDGHLVLVVEHSFSNVPSWVEWDGESRVMTIAQMNGDLDEAKIEIKKEFLEQLKAAKKVLLVSNDNEERIMQCIPFFARV